ncbi:MAG: glycosyltransferase [Rhodospirillaceae bacterium]|nr:glycosyltransferase [Rhodospirillaceae bacterium]
MPRFLHISNYYPDYLGAFYQSRPQLALAPYDVQMDAILGDHFSSSHVFTRQLRPHGFETLFVLGNNPYTQLAWLREQNIPVVDNAVCMQAMLLQLKEFNPDIFYTTDVVTLHEGFFRMVDRRPPLVAGWRGFPIARGVDLSCYDLILSSFDRMFTDAKAHGAKHVERFHPGFPDDCAAVHEPRRIDYDVVFSGSVTQEHLHRIQLLNMVAEASTDPLGPFSMGFFVPRDKMLSPLVQSLNKGARWGVEMLRTLRNARIVINIDVDSFGAQPPNVRLMEATGAGAFLLTSYHPELEKFFEPGVEIETFRSPLELLSKIKFYLSFPERADEIARRGQERCLKDHAASGRAAWLAQILNDALSRKRAGTL